MSKWNRQWWSMGKEDRKKSVRKWYLNTELLIKESAMGLFWKRQLSAKGIATTKALSHKWASQVWSTEKDQCKRSIQERNLSYRHLSVSPLTDSKFLARKNIIHFYISNWLVDSSFVLPLMYALDTLRHYRSKKVQEKSTCY